MRITNGWVVGFVDGDGSFLITIDKKTNFKKYSFIVTQNERSIDVLYAFQKKFMCGFISSSGGRGNVYSYRVNNKEDLKKIILPFFKRNPPNTFSKYRDFKILYETLFPHQKLPDLPNVNISNNWLAGFLDADGCFYVSMTKDYPRPQVLIGVHASNKEILFHIQTFLGFGVIFDRNSSFSIFQLSSMSAFQKIIFILCKCEYESQSKNGCLLKTTIRIYICKRFSFFKFKEVVEIMQHKKHLTSEGVALIKEILKFVFTFADE